MQGYRTIGGKGPEAKIVEELRNFLVVRGWFVVKMHGSQYQAGFPDLYCTHSHFGIRLVEVKDPKRGHDPFTPAQLELFPKLSANGSKIFVLTAANEEQYKLLFGPENWYQFLGVMKV